MKQSDVNSHPRIIIETIQTDGSQRIVIYLALEDIINTLKLELRKLLMIQWNKELRMEHMDHFNSFKTTMFKPDSVDG